MAGKRVAPSSGGMFGLTEPQDGSGLSDAADAWERMLDDNEDHAPNADDADRPKAKKRQPVAEEEDDTEELEEEDDSTDDAEDDDSEDDETDDDSEDDETDEGDDEDEGDDDSTDEIDPTTKVKVKIDGKEEEVTLAELQDGYSRTQDYTRKTQALAQQRQQLEQEQDSLAKLKGDWNGALQQLNMRLQASLSGRTEAQWQELRAKDEIAYFEERDKERQIAERMQAIQTERQRVEGELAEQQRKQHERMVRAEQERLLAAVPEWRDQKVFQADINKVKQYAGQVGFQEQELMSIADHRVFKVLRDAAKFQEMQASRAKARTEGKVKTRSKAKKPLPAGAPSNVSPSKRKAKDAQRRHAKAKTVASAASVFEQFLDD